MVRSAASRTLDRVGRDVVIRNYKQTGTDRPTWEQTDDSPYTVTARVDYTPATKLVIDSLSSDVDIDVAVFIKSGVAGGVSEIRDGGGDGASEVDVDNVTLIVVLKDVQDNGILRLECVREM